MPLRHGITKRSLRQRCAGFTFSISNFPEDFQNPCRRQLDALNLAIAGYRRCRRYGVESVVIADTVSFDNGIQIGAAIESTEMGNALKLRYYLPRAPIFLQSTGQPAQPVFFDRKRVFIAYPE